MKILIIKNQTYLSLALLFNTSINSSILVNKPTSRTSWTLGAMSSASEKLAKKIGEKKNFFLERNSYQARQRRKEFLKNSEVVSELRSEILNTKTLEAPLKDLGLSSYDLVNLTNLYLNLCINNNIDNSNILQTATEESENNLISFLGKIKKETKKLDILDNGSVFSRLSVGAARKKASKVKGKGNFCFRLKNWVKRRVIDSSILVNYAVSFVTYQRYDLVSMFDGLTSILFKGLIFGATATSLMALKAPLLASLPIVVSSLNGALLGVLTLPLALSLFGGALLYHFGFGWTIVMLICFFIFLSLWEVQMWYLKAYHSQYYLNNILIIDEAITPILAIISIPAAFYLGFYLAKYKLGTANFESYLLGVIVEVINYLTLLRPLFRVLKKQDNKEFISEVNKGFLNPLSWLREKKEPSFFTTHIGKICIALTIIIFVLVNYFSNGMPSGMDGFGCRLKAIKGNYSFNNNSRLSDDENDFHSILNGNSGGGEDGAGSGLLGNKAIQNSSEQDDGNQDENNAVLKKKNLNPSAKIKIPTRKSTIMQS